MLTAFSQRELVERARDAGAMAYLVKPFTKADLVPAIEMAVSRFQEIKSLEAEVGTLGSGSRPARPSTGPRACCRPQHGWSEPDAFRWIQKTSMDRRMTMRAVAEAVIGGGLGRAIRRSTSSRRIGPFAVIEFVTRLICRNSRHTNGGCLPSVMARTSNEAVTPWSEIYSS